MLYEYLLTAFKVIVGLITTEKLVYTALVAIGIYLVWISIALATSFQKKFYKNSVKLYNFLRKSQNNPNSADFVDNYASSISGGFSHGWKKFKREKIGKPSDYINRREALDVDINGGVLNQGKSFMRAYIWFVVVGEFLFNLAYVGDTQAVTVYSLAEALVLPLVLMFVLKIFYFLYTSVKQQLYRGDIEVFYDVIDLMDEMYANNQNVRVISQPVVYQEETDNLKEETKEDKDELEKENSNEVQEIETKTEENESEKTKKENPLDAFDIFKKKNIDVNKIMNEVPANSNSLPYINVDSDYVIGDSDTASAPKPVLDANNGSEILGGMMQDMSSIKKSSNFIDVEKPIAKIDEEKIEELKQENQNKENLENAKDERDPFASLGAFEVKTEENNVPNNENGNDIPPSLSESEVGSAQSVSVEEQKNEPIKEQIKEPVKEPEVLKPFEQTEKPVQPQTNVAENREEISDEEKQELATIVGGLKTKKSTLASGGVVIERNESFARRDRQSAIHENEDYEFEDNDNDFDGTDEVNYLETNDNADALINSLHSGFSQNGSGFETSYEGTSGQNFNNLNQEPIEPKYNGFNTGYVQPQNNPYASNFMQQQNTFNGYNNYSGVGYVPQNQNPYAENFDGFDNYDNGSFDTGLNSSEPKEIQTMQISRTQKKPKETIVQQKPIQKPIPKPVQKPKTKIEKGAKKVEKEVEDVNSKRGRPKKQVFDETLTIKDDKEFDEVLSRAEKLMRKSDEGLSQSQSKRIEKELKMLMDAMNRYKERR
jgi:hypothetical protein